MVINLDPETEARIQRQIERGSFSEPAELLAHALDVIEAQDDWFLRNQEAINERLEVSIAQAARGESCSPEESLKILAERRAARTTRAA